MTNFIKIEYFGYVYNPAKVQFYWYTPKYIKANLRTKYINPNQITSLADRAYEHDDGTILHYRMIVMASGETFISSLTADEILEKINGKPKK